MNNNKAIAAISTSKFLSRIPSAETSIMANEGVMLYSTDKSTHFNPLVLWKEGETILVTPQDSISEDKLISLFSDADVTPAAVYAFSESELFELIGDDPELLADIIAFLEEHPEFASKTLMELLAALKNEGFSVIHILMTLESLSRSELNRLISIFTEMRPLLRQHFVKLFCEQNSTDKED